jgi:hypothetical protein
MRFSPCMRRGERKGLFRHFDYREIQRARVGTLDPQNLERIVIVQQGDTWRAVDVLGKFPKGGFRHFDYQECKG